jgi:hypothetical protein
MSAGIHCCACWQIAQATAYAIQMGGERRRAQDRTCRVRTKCVYVASHIACCVRCCKPRCMLCAMLHATLRVVCDVACHVACCPACKNDCLTIIDGSASSSRSMFSSMLYLQVNRQTACGVWHERRCAEQAGRGQQRLDGLTPNGRTSSSDPSHPSSCSSPPPAPAAVR